MPLISLTRHGDGTFVISGDPSWRFGHRVAREDGDVDGVYAGWHWNGRALTIEHDRHGFYPLFTWTAADRCVIASSINALLDAGAPRDLDYEALSVFLRVGFFLGTDTPFRSIRALSPRPTLLWSDTGARLAGRPPQMPSRLAIGRDEAIDRFIAAFRAAIARRLPGARFELPLSGGRDSRHILFELVKAGCPPATGVTIEHFPPRGNDDVAVAAALCGRLGIAHTVVPQRRDRAAAEREKNERTHWCSDEHAQFVALAEYLRRSTPVTYDGLAGDVLSQSSYLNPQVQALVDRGQETPIAEFILDGYGRMVTDTALVALLAPAVLKEVPRERAVVRLAREVRRHLDAPNPISSFFFWNRTRREVALWPYSLMRDVTVHAPYLDRDVFDLLAALPASLEMDGRLHTDAIARAFPEYADVPYEARDRRAAGASLQRRLALSLLGSVMATREILRASALLPGVIATACDGSPRRLWHASLVLYLAQLGALASRAR